MTRDIGDIAYVATWEGWRYLAVLLDAHSRRVVGWAMADHLRTELALEALLMALGARRPPPGLVHHTDRGCQYTAAAYQVGLATRRLVCSMSRSGDCLDNAMAERFFATLKAEVRSGERGEIPAAGRGGSEGSTSRSPALPGGESRGGQEHGGKSGDARRRVG